jgi:hypothetical protein
LGVLSSFSHDSSPWVYHELNLLSIAPGEVHPFVLCRKREDTNTKKHDEEINDRHTK